ncbi:cyclin-like protein [Cristinia sonorae]|uniref:Cyclin-like protein n=1 Tax=Cristinia sonorae TaxID=1940300 RepID=A0A8K0XLA3_9AGAR|nr:cyclin-like protein [Cristinia sonorae]
MATVVSASAVPRHPTSPRKVNKPAARAASTTTQPDAYYGHEETAKICARFVTHLFACPDVPPPSASHPPAPTPPLALFIAYALHRTRLHSSVTFAALYLLQRLKARFPAARGSSGHRLFISAFMLASKVICDDTYSNKSWSIVGQGMFALREINQMEREMCSYLEWQLNVEPTALKDFEIQVRRDFKGSGPYPTYQVPSPAPSPMPSTTPYNKPAQLHPPSFVTGSGPSKSPPEPASSPMHTSPTHYAPLTPPMSPSSPDTPEAYHSTSTSPASTVSPPTPPGHEDLTAKIVTPPGALASSMDSHHHTSRVPAQKPHHHGPAASRPTQRRRSDDSISEPARKPKSTADLYAYAVPCHW